MPQAIALSGTEWVPIVQGGTTKRTQTASVSVSGISASFPAGIDYVMFGGGSAVPLGVNGTGLLVPFPCTINEVVLTGNGSGSAVVDIWKTTKALYDGGITHPKVGDSITGASKPTIVAGSIYQDTTLTGWTTALNTDDILWYNVVSNNLFVSMTLALRTTRAFP